MRLSRLPPALTKPCTRDGFRFLNRHEANRYRSLRALMDADTQFVTEAIDARLFCYYARGGKQWMVGAFSLVQPRPNKYGATKVVDADGTVHDSKREARRWYQLKALEAAGEIQNLTRHVRYDLVVNGIKIGRYTSDAEYTVVKTEERVVEDAKSSATRKARDYPLRKKLMLACHGITIAEV